MFHTLFDYQDQNFDINRQIKNNKYKGFINNSSRDCNTYYYWKGNDAYDLYNKKENDSDNSESSGDTSEKFEKTKNKVKLIVYKNGFILNNGPFRDKIIPENAQFLEQVGRGVIPHELAEKGMSDLGILLINRKTEIYSNNKYNKYNSFGNYDFFKNPYQNINQNQNKYPKPLANNIIPLRIPRVNSSKNIQKIPNKIELPKSKKISRKNCSEPKKDAKDKEKKFTAFSGSGKMLRNINMIGLQTNKNIKTVFDIYQPVCTVSIRLFNGEVAKCQFNYSQTLRDIYYHVRRISGSNNFYLLDGFPPRPLRDYDRTIYELNLQNSLLTQRIN